MDRAPLATAQFGMVEQLAFAALSGDHNPMHVDAQAARRTQPGAPVVHGIYALLWALDQLAGAGMVGRDLCQITAQFRKFIYLNVACDLVVVQHDAGGGKAELRAGGLVVATLQFRNGESRKGGDPTSVALPDVILIGNAPKAPELSELTGLSGWVSAPASAEEIAGKFPRLADAIGKERAAAIASLSRLVGMVCPGLNSIFAGFTADIVPSQSGRSGIGFKVSMVNDRLRTVGIDVGGSGVTGKVMAFMRWPPVEAPSMEAIAQAVVAREFAGAVALIVGGSRGLGAVTAKAIAAGGGRVIVTYAKGREEAERLAQEIDAARGPGTCMPLAYDSALGAAAQLSAVSAKINQLYFFATPPIYRQTSQVFSAEAFATFSSVYLDAFYDVCLFARARSEADVLSVLYPSSIFATEQRPIGLTEYAMAKAAGEVLCADLMRHIPGLNILVPRLPRVLTDQTATIAPIENADPLAVILPLIRALQKPA